MYNAAMKLILIPEIVVFGALVYILDYYAKIHSFYFSIWWFDIMMHFLGGLLAALVFIRVLYVGNWFGYDFRKHTTFFINILGAVLVVGLAWELFEVFAGMTEITALDIRDTIEDLIMDTLGAIVACGYYLLRKGDLDNDNGDV